MFEQIQEIHLKSALDCLRRPIVCHSRGLKRGRRGRTGVRCGLICSAEKSVSFVTVSNQSIIRLFVGSRRKQLSIGCYRICARQCTKKFKPGILWAGYQPFLVTYRCITRQSSSLLLGTFDQISKTISCPRSSNMARVLLPLGSC